ncbi:MAG: hypothetical protein ACTH2Q_03215 [Propionibacteriaceae bacterium]
MENARTGYVVHLDRRRLNRRQGILIGMNGFLVVAVVCLYGWFFSVFAEMASSWFIVFVLLALGPLFQIILHTWSLGRMSATSRPLVIGSDGIELHSPDGYVRLPWQAIEMVTTRSVLLSQLLVVRVRPGAEQDPQVIAEVAPGVWKRNMKHGVLTNTGFIVEPVPEVLRAVAHFADGRVRIGP